MTTLCIQSVPTLPLDKRQSDSRKTVATSRTSSFESAVTGDNRKFHSTMNLQSELFRLQTYKDWPLAFIKPADLARAGFFYLHEADKVQCYFCRGVVGYWEKGDVPMIEHRKHYPQCRFASGSLDIVNIPYDGSRSSKILSEFLANRLATEPPAKTNKPYCTDSAKVASKDEIHASDHYPTYSSLESRIRSFQKNCPSNLPEIKLMAEAGFFYIMSDMVQCYACGGGVFNWSKDEKPSTVHDALYPYCRLAHSDEDGQDTPSTCISPKRKRPADLDNALMELPMAKKLMEAGFEDVVIKGALSSQLVEFGRLPANINEALDITEEFEEQLLEGNN